MSQEIFGRKSIGTWKIVSDERLILQRAIVPNKAYEMLKVSKEDSGDFKFLHEVIFCENYRVHELERVLSAFGYQSLKEFVEDCTEKAENQKSEFEEIDWETLSMFICDTHGDGILMGKDDVIQETKKITGIDIYL